MDDAVFNFVDDLGTRLPLAVMLLDSTLAEQLVQAVKYVEKTTTLETPADHIGAKTLTVGFQVWIAQGDRPLPLRVLLPYKNTRGQLPAEFSDWNLDTKPSDTLSSTPLTSAKQIPFAAILASIAPAQQGSASRMKGGKQ